MKDRFDSIVAITEEMLAEYALDEEDLPDDPGVPLDGTGVPAGAAARASSRLGNPAYGVDETWRQITGEIQWRGDNAIIHWNPVQPRQGESYWLRISMTHPGGTRDTSSGVPLPIWILLRVLRDARGGPFEKELAYKEFGIDPDKHLLKIRLHVERANGEAL
jgi:hypothetical protein